MSSEGFTTSISDTLRNIGAFTRDLVRPTLRLGVTGLARSGKTVFITAFIHNLLAGGRLPFFDPVAQGRLVRAYLEPQPDDAVPRFDYERHPADLEAKQPHWPESTRRLAQLRLTLEYEPKGYVRRQMGLNRLHVDIVDYPGEWLLDLPLLEKDYAWWSQESLDASTASARSGFSRHWRRALQGIDAADEADESLAAKLAELFKDYLRACRSDPYALSTVPPGRFL
ncbi:MAG: YcjX family protein, partial [Pseudomonadota bacterium]|nr:YcjX family protein [Pseudomonadota bacterium]